MLTIMGLTNLTKANQVKNTLIQGLTFNKWLKINRLWFKINNRIKLTKEVIKT